MLLPQCRHSGRLITHMQHGVSPVGRARRPLNHFSERRQRVIAPISPCFSTKTLSWTLMTLPSYYFYITAKFPRISLASPPPTPPLSRHFQQYRSGLCGQKDWLFHLNDSQTNCRWLWLLLSLLSSEEGFGFFTRAGFWCHYSFSRRSLWNLFPTLYLQETITQQEALLRTLECWQEDNSTKCRRKEVHMTEGAAATISFGTLSNTSDPLVSFLPLNPWLPQDQGSTMFFVTPNNYMPKKDVVLKVPVQP